MSFFMSYTLLNFPISTCFLSHVTQQFVNANSLLLSRNCMCCLCLYFFRVVRNNRPCYSRSMPSCLVYRRSAIHHCWSFRGYSVHSAAKMHSWNYCNKTNCSWRMNWSCYSSIKEKETRPLMLVHISTHP